MSMGDTQPYDDLSALGHCVLENEVDRFLISDEFVGHDGAFMSEMDCMVLMASKFM